MCYSNLTSIIWEVFEKNQVVLRKKGKKKRQTGGTAGGDGDTRVVVGGRFNFYLPPH